MRGLPFTSVVLALAIAGCCTSPRAPRLIGPPPPDAGRDALPWWLDAPPVRDAGRDVTPSWLDVPPASDAEPTGPADAGLALDAPDEDDLGDAGDVRDAEATRLDAP
jgi:hypothetical protein